MSLQKLITLYSGLCNEVTRLDQPAFATLKNFFRAYYTELFSLKEILLLDLTNTFMAPERRERFVSKELCSRFRSSARADGHTALLDDKAIFDSICRSYNLPIADTFAVFDEPIGWLPLKGNVIKYKEDWSKLLLEDMPSEFLIKAAGSAQAKGISFVKRQPDNFFIIDGVPYTANDLISLLSNRLEQVFYTTSILACDRQKTLLQKRIFNHSDIRKLTGNDALQTLRITTFTERGKEAIILYIFMKLVGKNNKTDNFNSGTNGNMIVEIDIDTGNLIQAFEIMAGSKQLTSISVHPKTNQRFCEFCLPCFQETMELARLAGQIFLPHQTVGWDIAITDDGPIILEGNLEWDSPPIPFSISPQEMREIGLLPA